MNLKYVENKKLNKEEKMPEPTQSQPKDNLQIFEGQRLFDEPMRINHLMSQNIKTPYRINNVSKRNYKKMNITSLSGQGVIMAEEDIDFSKKFIGKFYASSTVRWKSSTALVYSIKVEDLERETRTLVSILKLLCDIERVMA